MDLVPPDALVTGQVPGELERARVVADLPGTQALSGAAGTLPVAPAGAGCRWVSNMTAIRAATPASPIVRAIGRIMKTSALNIRPAQRTDRGAPYRFHAGASNGSQGLSLNFAVSGPAITASVHEEPTSHDGEMEFTFELRFSENVTGLSYKTLRDHAFKVTGGEVKGARRLEQGRNARWEIKIGSTSSGDVNIELPVTTDCEAQGAICT